MREPGNCTYLYTIQANMSLLHISKQQQRVLLARFWILSSLFRHLKTSWRSWKVLCFNFSLTFIGKSLKIHPEIFPSHISVFCQSIKRMEPIRKINVMKLILKCTTKSFTSIWMNFWQTMKYPLRPLQRWLSSIKMTGIVFNRKLPVDRTPDCGTEFELRRSDSDGAVRMDRRMFRNNHWSPL